MRFSSPLHVACMGLAISTSAAAQWTVTVLTPQAAKLARAYGIFGDQQVGDGYLNNNTSTHAFLWEGTSESWSDLHPAGASSSVAYATDGVHQVGLVLMNSVGHASIWTGTADSWVSLNPAGAQSAGIRAIAGGSQAGWATINGAAHASLWYGTAESWIDLNPTGTWNGYAWGADEFSQVGQVSFGWVYYASLWRGSAATYVNLDPLVSPNGSVAWAVWGDQQVGYVDVGNEDRSIAHASLWRGSAASWVDLDPSGSNFSEALGVFGEYQVGYVNRECAFNRAALWHGSAATWEDLHQYLPIQADNSWAYGVWCDDTTIYVVGEADGRGFHAVLWSRPIDSPPPTCRADIDGNGFVNGDDFDAFAGAFEAGGPLADFDFNCFVNGDDYDIFAGAFEAGC